MFSNLEKVLNNKTRTSCILEWVAPHCVVFARLACSTDSVCVIFFGFTQPASRPAVPSKSGNADIDLITVPKLPKHVSKNVPNFVAGGVTRGFFEVQKMPLTSRQGALREGFLEFWFCMTVTTPWWRPKSSFYLGQPVMADASLFLTNLTIKI